MFKHNDIISVYLPLKIDGSYAYKVPQDMQLSRGDIIIVPLRNQEVIGIVHEETEIDFPADKVKDIISKVEDIPSLPTNLMDFLFFLAKYNLANFGNVLKMAISIAGVDFSSYKQMLEINRQKLAELKITPQRQKIIDALAVQPLDKKSLVKAAEVSPSTVNTLIKDGFLSVSKELAVSNLQENISYKPLELLDEQKTIAANLNVYFQENAFKTGVLQGLPGSGKTEVYFELVNKAIEQGKQVLILLPEIGLSTQIVERFTQRFSVEPYTWHSSISKKHKKDAFISAANGNLKVIIGARSALFLPFKDLGLIIVDEEHDSSYKQEEGVIYNARDMAVVRAKFHNIPVLLCSATPSLETLNNVEQGKYGLFKLQQRANQMLMPDINVVDMKTAGLKGDKYLSARMIAQITETVAKKEQALLFVNKRGYASALFCTACSEKETCPNCSVSLVEHRSRNILSCHFCGFTKKITNTCSHCGEADTLISMGAGVERIFAEVESHFPDKRIAILSSDTIDSHKKAMDIVRKINNHEYDILIGTQIISKGYNFPLLTFVGIVDADFSYSLDLKSSEKTWQILYQVAGRSGRAELAGSVMLQTYDTSNALIESLVQKDYELFIKKETSLRQTMEFPPFGKLIAVIISSKNGVELEKFCHNLENTKPLGEGFEILGAANAPIFLLRGFYRKRFLIKSAKNINIQKIAATWLFSLNVPSNIKIQIDVDPISFY
ncbi:MAG: primosomal protein N' [Alphaproteobacteria bacterium]|jgi:primosomal protein N' (replication factor Y)|nr:primosomal protein N' [Alphaproteobacteria bacterium]